MPFPTDPKKLAAQFTSAGQLAGFLTDLLGAVSFSSSELEPVMSILANWTPGASSDASPEIQANLDAANGTAEATAESRRRIKALVGEYVPEGWTPPPAVVPARNVAEMVAGYRG